MGRELIYWAGRGVREGDSHELLRKIDEWGKGGIGKHGEGGTVGG